METFIFLTLKTLITNKIEQLHETRGALYQLAANIVSFHYNLQLQCSL